MEKRQFNFGRNWKAFSEHALTLSHIEQAKKDFTGLLGGIDIRERSFLDIGFGQGLTLLLATSMGAATVGCDVNPLCREVLYENQMRYFPKISRRTIPIVVGSILEEAVVESLRLRAPGRGYDIVHAWGVLHHTGDMKRAIRMAGSLVVPGGHFIIAIYNRHWSSKAWRAIKRFYNRTPSPFQRLLIWLIYPVIYVAKLLVARRNPLKRTRGMDFYYDVVDWVGGYPYEYASVAEIVLMLQAFGFGIVKVLPAEAPTGCNEFVFQRKGSATPGTEFLCP